MKFIATILFIFFVTESIYESNIPGLNYFDEAITIFAFLYLLFEKHKINKRSYESHILVCISVVAILGIISTFTYHYQPQFAGVWRDFLALLKFPVCYCAFSDLRNKYRNCSLLNTSIIKFSKYYILIIFLCGAINFIKPIDLFSDGYRYGFPLFKFIYSHATFLVASLVVLVSVMIADGLKKNKLYIILGLICLLFTLRSKPVIVVIFVLLCIYMRQHKALTVLSKKRLAFYFILTVSLSLYFMSGQILEYIKYGDTAARTAFYIFGIDIAINNFPLGSGFCTFASSLSHKYYSPLYYEYDMQYINGITETDGSYAGDTFWPNIFAQYGILGFVFYLMMLYFIFKSLNSRYNILSDKWIASMILLLYSFVAAFAESFYTNATGVIYALVLACYIDTKYNKTIK